MTPPVLGIAGWSGSGKTTLLERLIPALARRGVRVGVIKQTHHDFELDRPGKDSHRLRQAGASRRTPSRRSPISSFPRCPLPGRHDNDA